MESNVIKVRSVPDALSSSRIKRESHQASLEARDIVSEAEQRAARILEDALQEKEAIFKQASEDGHRAGLDKWSENLTEAWSLREAFLARNEADLVRLAIAIARKVIGNEVESDASRVMQTVREALKSVRREKSITVQVNPSEEAAVREQSATLRSLLPGARELEITTNPSVAPGGCIIETELGTVDAQIETQLAALEKALLRRRDGDSSRA